MSFLKNAQRTPSCLQAQQSAITLPVLPFEVISIFPTRTDMSHGFVECILNEGPHGRRVFFNSWRNSAAFAALPAKRKENIVHE
jgi:hypothetical protein